MIANIAQTLIGIWLVYAAVLNPVLLASPFRMIAIVAGLVIAVLSMVARRSDYHPWHSNVTITLGVALLLLGLWNLFEPTATIINYWSLFWVGVLVAFVALWAALYRPHAPAT